MARFDVELTALDGIVVLRPTVFRDARGYFLESYNKREFERIGLPTEFVQDNLSQSQRGVIRGLHFQWDPPLGKLIRVIVGRIQLVELDIRPGSPYLGNHLTLELSDDNHRTVWIPPGFANGFLVLSQTAIVQYKCSAFYNPQAEGSIRWNDPALGIPWQLDGEPIVSDKDANGMTLSEWLAHPAANHFAYHHHQT